MYYIYYIKIVFLFVYVCIKITHFNREDFIRYITTDNENDMHISSDSDIDLIEDYDDQNTANMPNEIETSNMDETLIITDSAELCQSNDIENKGIIIMKDYNISMHY